MIDMDSTENVESERRKRQKEVLSRIIQGELTEVERQVFIAYHIQCLTITKIAAKRGVQKSSVSRALHRAERKIHRITQYL